MPEMDLEAEARREAGFLFDSAVAKRLPPAEAESLIIIAFVIGASWAFGDPKLLELAKAQYQAALAKIN